MFKMLQKKDYKKIFSPVNGRTYSIENVEDETFSKRIVGDGVAIRTVDQIVVSPIDGIIRVITNTNHAVMIENSEVELLIHVGVNTCRLKGKGFEVLTSLNKKVKVGDPLIKVDHELFKDNNLNSDVLIIVTNLGTRDMVVEVDREVIKGKSVIAEINPKKGQHEKLSD